MTVNQRFNVSPWYEVPKHEALDNIKSNVKKTVAPLHQKLHNMVSEGSSYHTDLDRVDYLSLTSSGFLSETMSK